MASHKLKLSLLLNFSPALVGATRCLEQGREIYNGRDQLQHAREKPEDLLWSNTLNGVCRHLLLRFMGEVKDQESNESHLDHAISRLLFLSTAEKLKLGTDDLKGRFTPDEIQFFWEFLNAPRCNECPVRMEANSTNAAWKCPSCGATSGVLGRR